MPNRNSFVRKTLQKLLLDDGFKDFDGINFYFTISDETIGWINLHCFPSKFGGVALFTPSVGLIHFRMNCLLHDFLENTPLWSCTLNNDGYSRLLINTPQIEFKNEESTTVIRERLQLWFDQFKERTLVQLRTRYSDIQSIANYIESHDTKDPELWFASQYLLAGEAKIPEIKAYIARLANKFHWRIIEYKLDRFVSGSVRVEDNATARERVFAAADARRQIVLQDPPSKRPTS